MPRAGVRWMLLIVPALLAACAGLRIYFETSGWSSLSTGIGDYRKQPLSDGSLVELNTASTIRYRLGQRMRQVYLTAGEAKFRVAHDPARPFVVIAGDTVVRDVGTAFTVRLLENGRVEVLVSQGVVAVSHQLRDNPLLELLRGRAIPLQGGAAVTNGSMVTDDGGHFDVIEVSRTTIDAHDAWRKSMLMFEGTPLRDVAAEFNRYNRKRIEIDASLANVRMGGQYGSNDVDGFLQHLNKLIPIRVIERQDGRTPVLQISADKPRGSLQR